MLAQRSKLLLQFDNPAVSLFKPGGTAQAFAFYQRIPIDLVDMALSQAVKLAAQYNMYAYDAYMLACAQQCNAPRLSLAIPGCWVA